MNKELASIVSNKQAYDWGINCRSLNITEAECIHFLEIHNLTRAQMDDFWEGYLYGVTKDSSFFNEEFDR